MKSSAPWFIALIAFGSWPVTAPGGDLADREMSVYEVIAALRVNDLSANEVRAIDSYVRLDVVDLSAFESSDEYQALETALGNTDDGWAMMQTAIIGNDLIERELKHRSVDIGRVVAATMDDKGGITVYIR